MTATIHRGGGAAMMASHPQFQRLKQTVIATTGLHYYADKEDILAERIEARQSALGCSPTDYFNRVLDPSDSTEFAALVDEITVGESYFFRYPQQFDGLKDVVLPACAADRPPDQTLRIWSAGCASGAEAYSLAILLRGDSGNMPAGRRYSILGTDINRKAIAAARVGLYNNWDLRVTTDEQKRRWFDEAGPNWSIRQEFRHCVEFARQNLVTDIDAFASAHAGAFDIIFCRNVMIYFGAELMHRILQRISDCLVDGGWLFVGHAEPYFEIANFLVPVPAAGAAIYRKAPAGTIAGVEPPSTAWPGLWAEEAPSVERDSHDSPAMAASKLDSSDATPAPAALEPQPGAVQSMDIADVIRRHSVSGDWPAAMEASDEALRQRPLDATLHFVRALICEHIGTQAAAEQALRQTLYLDRSFALAHYHLGRLLAARGDHKSATRSFTNTLKLVAGRSDADAMEMGDGLTVAELRDLTRIHLDLLERRP